MTAAAGLEAGERAPDFVLPGPGGTPSRFYAAVGGRPAAVVFADPTDPPVGRAVRNLASQATAAGVDVVVVAPVDVPSDLGLPAWTDADGAVGARYRIPAGAPPLVVLCDANVRALATLALQKVTAGSMAALADPRPPPPVPAISAQAPVLLIPRALDPSRCAALMATWEREGNTETGVEASSEQGRATTLSAVHKRRRDHTVTDRSLLGDLSTAVGRRVMPEVAKAFAYRATRFEGFKIGCYDAASGGHFRAHRDNLSPSTAHRRFALTLNLNDGYEGGELVFPEYGPQRYRPDAGAALVFSCALLHEVRPVTEGRRFVLLSFLFGADAPGGS